MTTGCQGCIAMVTMRTVPGYLLVTIMMGYITPAVALFGRGMQGDLKPSPVLISPILIELEENAQLDVTCTVSPKFRDTHNASHLYFNKSQQYTLGHPYFTVLSATEARLHVPMATYKAWRGVIMCGLGDIEVEFHHLQNQSASVVFRRDPLPPKIESCVVHNWESLRCDWSPSVNTQLTHTKKKHHFRYKFMWSVMNDPLTHYCCRDNTLATCLSDGTNLTDSCELTTSSSVNTFHMGALYTLVVRAETDKAFSVDRWRNGSLYNTTQHVKPDPPVDLTMTAHNATHSLVSWLRPVTSWQPAYSWVLQYDVVIESNYTKTSYTVRSLSRKLQLFVAVTPFTSYSVTVDTVPEIGGYHSDEAKTTLSTPPAVPSLNPDTHPSGYTYEKTECDKSCMVTVYWQPLQRSQLNGRDFCYIVKTRVEALSSLEDIDQWETQEVVCDPLRYSAKVKVMSRSNVQVGIFSRNALGENTNEPQIITVMSPEKLLVAEEHLVVEVETHDPSGRVFAWIDRPSSDHDYWVVWKNTNTRAESSPIGWTPLPADGASLELSLAEPSLDYVYGFVKSAGGANSGIVWRDQHEGVYSLAPVVLPPSEFRVVRALMHSLTLTWRPHEYQRAYVTAYRIRFCEVDANTCSCKEPVRHMVQVIPASETKVDLLSLTADTLYNISISSVTRQQESEPLYVQGVARTNPGLSVLALSGIVVGAVIGLIICTIGIYTYCKKCKELKKWFSKGIIVKFPEETKTCTRQESTSSEMPLFPGSSFHDYSRQVSGVSDVSSDGEPYSFQGTDTQEAQPCLHRVSYSPKSLGSIPENNDDVFEGNQNMVNSSSDSAFVKSYKLVPSNDPEIIPSSAWTKPPEPTTDHDVGGISKYAILSMDQRDADEGCTRDVPSSDKTNMEVVNELFQKLLAEDASDSKTEDSSNRMSPTNHVNYLPNNFSTYVPKGCSVSPSDSRLGSPTHEIENAVPNGHAQNFNKLSNDHIEKDTSLNNNSTKSGYLPIGAGESYMNMKPKGIPVVSSVSVV